MSKIAIDNNSHISWADIINIYSIWEASKQYYDSIFPKSAFYFD